MVIKEKFKYIANGYGFEEETIGPEGKYCQGCFQIIKRPRKIYSNGNDTMCMTCVIYFYGEISTKKI